MWKQYLVSYISLHSSPFTPFHFNGLFTARRKHRMRLSNRDGTADAHLSHEDAQVMQRLINTGRQFIHVSNNMYDSVHTGQNLHVLYFKLQL